MHTARAPQSALSLPTLLSTALVVFTVEFDNEFERRLIEPTGETFKTWKREVFLVSLVMWANYLRFLAIGEQSAGELARLACCDDAALKSALNGLTRWRYVTVEPPRSSAVRKPPFGQWTVQPTPVGERCLRIWQPLPGVVEERWRTRFGGSKIDRLRGCLARIIRQRHMSGPRYLPVVSSRRAMYSHVEDESRATAEDLDYAPLYTLLARTLLACTLDFEAESPLALPPSANALRVLDETGIPVRDLPRRSGVSKEAVAQALNLLGRHRLAIVEPILKQRGKQVRLTDSGQAAQATYLDRLRAIERGWQADFGTEAVGSLRESLCEINDTRLIAESPLEAALAPHPCNWRSFRPMPEVLPDHPMVLDRGGWPDGS